MKLRHPVNYIYFGVLFIVLSVLHIYHIFLIENATAIHRFFYSVYAIGQCAIEVGALLILGHLLAPRFPRIFNTIFVIFTFLLFLIHLVDFPLIRIMGMTIWYVFDFIWAESLENFMEMLYATHVSLTSWMLAGLAVIAIPLVGIAIFRLSHKWAEKRPVYFSYAVIGMTLFSSLFFLSMFDWKTRAIATPDNEGPLLQALPWKTTLLSPGPPLLKVGRLFSESSEKSYRTELSGVKITARKKPNIFLFVVESLREDFLTAEVTPALAAFREENHSFKHSIAAANGTHLSWFSIFHSVYPFYWGARQPKEWRSGSLPLQILKKAGYQVRLYSGSRLAYYQMDQRLFGKDHHLADSYQLFFDAEENYQNDAACVAAVEKDLSTYSEGNVFIIFLESTHFGYSWPKNEIVSEAPHLDFFNLACFNGHGEGVKCRYKNALHFIDKIFGQFNKTLQSVPGGPESVVVFTGDHGEEFYEEGRIFHASNLNDMQTHVPLYIRLGSATLPQRELASHLDIFPTILDHVLGSSHFGHWFDGESLLHPSKKNFAISTRYNASRSPFEFLIHNGKNQLIARFEDKYDIFKSKTLELISRRNEEGNPLSIESQEIEQDFKTALEALFSK